jgi:GTP diphosphokinase / guanosine-3',5'-bis(diphosphate) 3'-diphosphatase
VRTGKARAQIRHFLKKGQGLEVHLHDCPAIARYRADAGRWIDVEWEPVEDRFFEVGLRILTRNTRGVLARVAAAIAHQDSNIHTVSMDTEQGSFSALNLTLEVHDRPHLARVMRAVRRIQEVVRLSRTRNAV